MKVLVAGATGAAGSRLTPLLLAAGHRVAGLTRSQPKAEALRQVGVEAIVVDAFDRNAVSFTVAEARPEVVVHEMTSLANASDLVHFNRTFATTNRLRTEALDNLIAAAAECGARRLAAQRFCGWPYARTGGPVKSENDPLDPEPPREMRATLDAIRHLESRVAGSSKLEGVVLRYGAFYGPRSGLFDGSFLGQLRKRRAPLIGRRRRLVVVPASGGRSLGDCARDRDGRTRHLQRRR